MFSRVHLGAADRELYAAGLPTAARAGESGIGKAMRPVARLISNLMSHTNPKLLDNAKVLPPIVKTLLGLGLGLATPNLLGGAKNIASDYAFSTQ